MFHVGGRVENFETKIDVGGGVKISIVGEGAGNMFGGGKKKIHVGGGG